MSSIVFANKSLALATGLRWSVLNASPAKSGATIRMARRTVGATKYVVDQVDEQAYLGLFTPGVTALDMSNSKHRNIHSLAMVFIEAVLRSSEIDRSMLHAILAVSHQEGAQGGTTALVIIEGGKIIHDGLESFGRAVEIINEHRSREEKFQLFCDKDEFDDATIIEWNSLAEYASKNTHAQGIPRDPAQYAAMFAVLFAVGSYGAYYYFIALPEKRAEEARKKAELDRTPLYLQALEEAMQKAGWAIPSMVSQIQKLNSDTYFHKGWALKGLDCNVNGCLETWDRIGGMVPELMQMRQGGTYIPERSISDKVAAIQMPIAGEAAKLTHEMIPMGGVGVHKLVKPVLNKLENAGAMGQFGENMTWPVMPMTGVKSDVVVKRTRLEIHYKQPFAVEALKEMPGNFVPESFVLSTAQGMSISIKGFVYEK